MKQSVSVVRSFFSLLLAVSLPLACARRQELVRDVRVTNSEWSDISACAQSLGQGSGYEVTAYENGVRLVRIRRDRARVRVVEMAGVSIRTSNGEQRSTTWMSSSDYSSGTAVRAAASVQLRQIRQQLESVCLSRAAEWSDAPQ